MKSRSIQILATLTLLACLVGSSLLVPPINHKRQELQLAGLGAEISQTLPPGEIVTAAALSTFRGLAIDFLWYRLNGAKEEGNFYEINQISQWITTLQPRFPQVWSFHAWNMAYNVSVATNTQDERWDWVNKGIALLRDKGIPYNPRAIRLYRELSWIFHHKIGQYTDDVHWYYKRRLATEWQEVLGAPNEGATAEEVIATFRKIAEAPETLAQLRTESPAVEPLLARLAEAGFQPDAAMLRRIGRLLMVTHSPDAGFLGFSLDRLEESDRNLAKILTDSQSQAGLEPLLAHLRKRALIDRYHMKPAYMLELMETYGPIDWRLAPAHACYWASLGTLMSRDVRNLHDVDLLNTYRAVIHALQDLMFRGRLSFDPVSQRIDLLPDPRFIDAYEIAKFKTEKELNTAENFGENTRETFDDGHENFLLTAIVFAYLYGDRDQAQKYFDRAVELYGGKEHNIQSGRYTLRLEDVVYREMTAHIDLQYHTRQFIDGMLMQAFQQGLANSRMDVYNRFVDMARRVHTDFQKNAAVTPRAQQDRMALLPFEQIVAESYLSMFRLPVLTPLTRHRIWINTPLDLRQRTYDRLRAPMETLFQQAGLDVEKSFPEPPDMEAWREANPAEDTKREDISDTFERQ